jgi:hypothetical protein
MLKEKNNISNNLNKAQINVSVFVKLLYFTLIEKNELKRRNKVGM